MSKPVVVLSKKAQAMSEMYVANIDFDGITLQHRLGTLRDWLHVEHSRINELMDLLEVIRDNYKP